MQITKPTLTMDEAEVREAIAAWLHRKGYRVPTTAVKLEATPGLTFGACVELELKPAQVVAVRDGKSRSAVADVCRECGLPHGQCDPEGVGHYRG